MGHKCVTYPQLYTQGFEAFTKSGETGRKARLRDAVSRDHVNHLVQELID